jgi:aryl-alcohol dehydrogenase-like predicted oxidoreductase
MTNPSHLKIGGEIEVNRMGFGAMRITGKGVWGWPSDRPRTQKLLQRVAELGCNFIDTSDAYGPETSEYILEEYLHPYKGLLIATKGGLERSGPRSWTTNGRPNHLKIACHNSLRRLGLEQIDLYQLHAIDDDVPMEDSIGALGELQKEGKIRHIGVSNFKLDELKRAQELVKVVSVQNRYNLADREHDDVVDYCEAEGIAFIPWYPLATGDLTRDEALATIAAKHKVKSGQVALAWLLHRSKIMVPIPGTTSVAHLEQNFASQKINLDDEDMRAIDGLGGA